MPKVEIESPDCVDRVVITGCHVILTDFPRKEKYSACQTLDIVCALQV